MLRAEGIRAGYGLGDVLDGVDVSVRPGAITALVGANGAGKTTLLRALAGLLRLTAGRVSADGTDVTGLGCAARVRRRLIALVPEGRQVFGGLTVAENLGLGAWTGGGAETARWDAVWDLFPALAPVRDRPAGLLSGGQQQMVALGRGLLAGPRYLLLDEPSLGLAPAMVESVFAAAVRLAESGIGVLVAEQNATAALAAAAHGYVLAGGRIVDSGGDLAGRPDLAERFLGVRDAVAGTGGHELAGVLAGLLDPEEG